MKKIGIFYGTTTGSTLEVAEMIARELNVNPQDVHDVARTAPSDVADYDVIILGASTWGAGDLQEDMAGFLDGLQSLDLEGKEVAIFGCGDESMADTFCNSVGEIYHRLHNTKAMSFGKELTGPVMIISLSPIFPTSSISPVSCFTTTLKPWVVWKDFPLIL